METTDNDELGIEAAVKSINAHVLEYMEDNGLTVAQMAKLLHTTPRTLKAKLEGRSAWRLSHIAALSDLTGKQIHEILG